MFLRHYVNVIQKPDTGFHEIRAGIVLIPFPFWRPQMGSKEEWFSQVLLLPGINVERRCQHQYLQYEHQYARCPLCFQWHVYKRLSHLSLLPSLIMSFLSEINNKMLYYGEQQELSSEEISEKLVLAQKMLEEIRSRQPFFTQRELVDEEADEAHECRSTQPLEPSTCLLSLWVQERTQRHRATFGQNSQFPIFTATWNLYVSSESFSTNWLSDHELLDPGPTLSFWETAEVP